MIDRYFLVSVATGLYWLSQLIIGSTISIGQIIFLLWQVRCLPSMPI